VRIKYDAAGRSEGSATILFKDRSLAVKYQKQFHGQILDGQALQIQLVREITKRGKSDNKKKSILDRLGSKKGAGNSLDDRLGPKPKSLDERLGTIQTIESRLGKKVEERLGKKKSRPKKNKVMGPAEPRKLNSYDDADVPSVDMD
jgi:hypothetical protein